MKDIYGRHDKGPDTRAYSPRGLATFLDKLVQTLEFGAFQHGIKHCWRVKEKSTCECVMHVHVSTYTCVEKIQFSSSHIKAHMHMCLLSAYISMCEDKRDYLYMHSCACVRACMWMCIRAVSHRRHKWLRKERKQKGCNRAPPWHPPTSLEEQSEHRGFKGLPPFLQLFMPPVVGKTTF